MLIKFIFSTIWMVKIMKYFVISDVHGNIEALTAAIQKSGFESGNDQQADCRTK